MNQSSATILIIGAGFAGVWAALGAAAKLDKSPSNIRAVQVILVAPEPTLYIRPQFYQADVSNAKADLTDLFKTVGVQFIAGSVQRIAKDENAVEYTSPDNSTHTLHYDRLVLATGSKVHRPPIPGLAEFAHSNDQYDEVKALDKHLQGLVSLPDSPARNTVAVCGGGFTGIETAAEMPQRLRDILGQDASIRVVVVERAADIGPELGPGPRPVIIEALSTLGVELVTNETVSGVDPEGVTTASGLRIPSKTVIWTGGIRASELTEQIPGEKDTLGRIIVDGSLRVPGLKNVFATGDTAYAAADDEGHIALLSCQHALMLGRYAGYNAAADLLGEPTKTYRQPVYVTCLDLGPWGAVLTTGWDRVVSGLTAAEAKVEKILINTKLIYPPAATDRVFALGEARPEIAYAAQDFAKEA